jgi:hypothetical protein
MLVDLCSDSDENKTNGHGDITNAVQEHDDSDDFADVPMPGKRSNSQGGAKAKAAKAVIVAKVVRAAKVRREDKLTSADDLVLEDARYVSILPLPLELQTDQVIGEESYHATQLSPIRVER